MSKLNIFTFLFALLFIGCKEDNIPTPSLPESTLQWLRYHHENSSLPDNQINTIAIDKNDNKWIGTANGLVKITAENWKIFNTLNTSLPSDHIRSVTIGNEGAIWVGTDQGLAYYSNNKWEVYTNTNSALSSNSITCITYNAQYKTTWVGTDEGIIKIDKENNWQYIFVNDLVISITTDALGNLWAGTFNPFAFVGKIKRYAKGSWTNYDLADLGYPSAFPYAIANDHQGNILTVLSGTSVRSLIKYNGNNWEEVERPEQARGLKSILFEGGKVWVGGANLSIFGNKLNQCLTIPDAGSIQTMAVDGRGKKWLGTLSGLVVLN